MTFNTGNPIGSTDARDLSDNAENFDKALGTLDATWTDRLGVTRDSFEGRLAKGSFYRVGDFATGYTLTNMRHTLEYSGHEYSWAGTFPKVVSAGSTPATSGGIGAGAWVDRTDVTLRSDLADPNSTVSVGGVEAGDLGQSKNSQCFLSDFRHLVVGDDWTDALWAAIESMRANQTSILPDIGAPSQIISHSSGTIIVGRGVFKLQPDTFQIVNDLGLRIVGQGSRRTNNSIRAATTLLFTGASSGYGFQQFGNGGRGFTLENLDVCYESSSFTGDVVDMFNSAGMKLNNVFIGTFGLTAETRLRTARSCVRSTYDEFLTLNNVVLDGATDLIWFDDERDTGGNPFGGSMTNLTDVVLYDCTNSMIRHDGLRTKEAVVLNNVAYNPIQVSCQRALNLNNIDGLIINGGMCAGSTTHKANIEWIRIVNCTGKINGLSLGANSPAGEVSGMIDFSNNKLFTTEDVRFTGGVITGSGNEYRTAGVTISPIIDICFDIGPDYFLAYTGNSYNVPADSVLLSGRINYNKEQDLSSLKFANASGRVAIKNVDEKIVTVPALTSTLSITDTGRTIASTGSGAQTFTVPAPIPGTELTITKIAGQDLTINRSAGNSFINGIGGTKTTISAAAVDVGGSVTLKAYSTGIWRVANVVGNWTFT